MAEVIPENRQVAEVLDMDVDDGGAEAEVVAKRGREEEEEGALSKRRKVVDRSFEEERMEKLGGGEGVGEELEERGGGAEEKGGDLKEGHGGDGEREGDFKEEGVDVEEAVQVPAEVSVGPKIFTSSVEMFDYFYKFLHSWSPNLDVNKYEHMVLLDLLQKGHAEPETKIGEGVKAFQVRFHRTWKSRCFFVIRIDETVDDFSFRKCVDNILSLPEEMKAKTELTMKAELISSDNQKTNDKKDWSGHKRPHGGAGGRHGGRGGGGGCGRRGGFRQ